MNSLLLLTDIVIFPVVVPLPVHCCSVLAVSLLYDCSVIAIHCCIDCRMLIVISDLSGSASADVVDHYFFTCGKM